MSTMPGRWIAKRLLKWRTSNRIALGLLLAASLSGEAMCNETEKNALDAWLRMDRSQKRQTRDILLQVIIADGKRECLKLTGRARERFSQCVIDFVNYERSHSFVFIDPTVDQ